MPTVGTGMTRRISKTWLFLREMGATALLPVAVLVSAACGGSPAASQEVVPETVPVEDGSLRVVSTVSPITNIVENIGGDRIKLEGIVPEGVNSHTFEPSFSLAATLANADVVFLNGLFLEQPSLEMAQANLKDGASIVSLGDQAVSREDWQFDFSFPESGGHPNPHLWPDPILGLRYAEIVRDHLSERDPENAGYYSANYGIFRSRINQLDEAIKVMVASVPQSNRKLLTYHDSWAYFARRYGMTVIGAVQPSDFSEPSVGEVMGLIEQIREEQIPAVFGSEVFPSDVMELIASESGATFIDDLSDDDLPGGPGDPRHSYLGLMVSNLEIMIPSLGGDASDLTGFDTGPVFDGVSRAIYPQ